MDYEPTRAPFELPVQFLGFRCEAERPFRLPPREGATPGTTLAGALGHALARLGCQRPDDRAAPCGVLPEGGVDCGLPQGCLLPVLQKPYSRVMRRSFPSPVRIHSTDLDTPQAVSRFDLEVRLWGRRAVAARDLVSRAVGYLGDAGILVEGEAVRFRTLGRMASHVQPLSRWAGGATAAGRERALLVLETPLVLGEDVAPPPEAGIPLADLLGNAAYDLVAWDLEDRGLPDAIDRVTRDGWAERARLEARRAAAAVEQRSIRLIGVDVGRRRSRGNGGRYGIRGLLGSVELTGTLGPAWPWLTAAAIGRAGQRRSLGFGEIRLWDAVPFEAPAPWGLPATDIPSWSLAAETATADPS